MIDLDIWQQEFELWIKHNFPDQTLELAALAVAEEAGELCRAVLKRAQGIRGTRAEWDEELLKEIGDVVMAATWVAYLSGHNVGGVLMDRWATIRQRDWRANPEGHGLPFTPEDVT